MFERFTDRSRRVVVLAQLEAKLLGHGHIGTEHLLLGLIHDESGIPAAGLAAAGVTLDAARVRVAEIVGPGDKTPRVHIPFTPRAKRVLELALREALQLGHASIRPEHMLLGLIREHDGVGAQVAERLGDPLPALRQRVIDAIAAPADQADEDDPRPVRRTWTWPSAPDIGADLRISKEPIFDLSHLITSLDRRLTNIEEHLGIPAEAEMMRGFRGLLVSVDRHLARIERRLGISAGQEPGAGTENEPEGETATGRRESSTGDEGGADEESGAGRAGGGEREEDEPTATAE